MYLFDTEALAHALTLPCDPKLRRLLRERVDHLATLDRAVAETTYFLVVDENVSSADIEGELGWSPLVDVDGGCFGTDAYHSFHDFAADRGGWIELLYGVSNEAVVVLLIRDAEGVEPSLRDLARALVE